MFFRNYRQNKQFNKNIKIPISDLIENIFQIRKRSDVLAICPKPTGYSWMGVYIATRGLFPDNTLSLPQYYSNTVFSDKELNQICDILNEQKFKNIVLSGFPPYFEKIALSVCKTTIVKVIYHGFLSELSDSIPKQDILNQILNLFDAGIIKSIAFNKKGMDETFKKIRKINAGYILLNTPFVKLSLNKLSSIDNKIHIGILANNNFRKNIHNQVAAALMIDNSIIHCTSDESFKYLDSENRIVRHPSNLSHIDYLNLLGSVDINMYITYSESWGLVITESLMLGVPCLAADNSGIFDYDDYLREMLIVKEFDDSNAIFKQAQIVLENKDSISKRGVDYVIKLNEKAQHKLIDFIS